MTPEQMTRLQELAGKLFEVVTVEVDPSNWTGNGAAPKDLTPAQRGDAVWCRKQAAASLALLMRVESLSANIRTGVPVEPQAPSDDDGDLDAEIRAAEAAAGRLMEKMGIPIR